MLKKILFVFIFVCLASSTKVQAGILSDYTIYVIPNSDKETIEKTVIKQINDSGYPCFQEDGDKDLYYYKKIVGLSGYSYFLKFFQDMNNTNIFVVTYPKKGKKINDFQSILKNANLKSEITKEKEIKKEYEYYFIKYIRANKPLNFKVVPNKMKWWTVTIEKIDKVLVKNNKEFPRVAYANDATKISLRQLTASMYSTKEFTVNRNEYRLKQKANRFVHAYEYVVTNNSESELTILSVDAQNIYNIKDITAMLIKDMDKIDMLDLAGTVATPFTFGISTVLSVPNWVRIVRTEHEAVRYTRDLPQEYNIAPGESARILTLKNIENPHPLHFILKSKENNYEFSF